MDKLEIFESYLEKNEKYFGGKITCFGFNKLDLKRSKFGLAIEDVEEFNHMWKLFRDSFDSDEHSWGEFKFTRSGAIKNMFYLIPSYGIRHVNRSEYEFLFGLRRKIYRIVVSTLFTKDKDDISGHTAMYHFEKCCQKYGIDLESMAVDRDTGLETKNSMQKAMIKMEDDKYLGQTLYNAHHIDLNTSYMSGIAKAFPVLAEPIKEIYADRKTPGKDKYYKAILTHSFGFFQSEYCRVNNKLYPYGLSHLSKAAIEYNNNYIKALASKLKKSGRQVIAYNTDGIWYTGEIYHGPGEGTELGQWKNDHTDCMLRFRSKGAYEFLELDQYTPVVRGLSKLDSIKPRDQWEWGDVMNCGNVYTYTFDEKKGFVKEDEE